MFKIVYIAKKFENTGIGIEDLISIGTIGLIKAVNTFVPSKGIKLATYASRCIENEILMYFRSQKKTSGDVSLSETIEADSDGENLYFMDVLAQENDMAETVEEQSVCHALRRYVDTALDERERQIITLRYGLNGKAPMTQNETAGRCGISRSYVSRIEKKALEKLRRLIEED